MKKTHKGSGFVIVEDNDKIQICWLVGAFGHEVCYDISRENMNKALLSDRDAYEVMVFAETGQWPANEQKREEARKEYLRRNPELLIKIPKNQEGFDVNELQKLLSIAEDKFNK